VAVGATVAGLTAAAPFAAAQGQAPYTLTTGIACVAGGESLGYYLYRSSAPAPRPVIVAIHGSGTLGPDWMELKELPERARLTRAGMDVLAIDLRDAWPARIEDTLALLQWVAQEAPGRGWDLGRVGIWGTSGGGQLAMLAALAPQGTFTPTPGCGAGPIAPIKAAAWYYGIADFTKPWFCGNPENAAKAQKIFGLDTTGRWCTPAAQAVLASASPLEYVSAEDPPVAFWHGVLDGGDHGGCPPGESEDMHDAAIRAGLDSSLSIVPDADHGWAGLTAGQRKEIGSELADWLIARLNQ
jgi:acetyl esterase/lipase